MMVAAAVLTVIIALSVLEIPISTAFRPHLVSRVKTSPLLTASGITESISAPVNRRRVTKNEISAEQQRNMLKSKLLARVAVCDRGFGASLRDRRDIAEIVEELRKLSPESVPTRGLYPYKFGLEKAEIFAPLVTNTKDFPIPNHGDENATIFEQSSITEKTTWAATEEIEGRSSNSTTSSSISPFSTLKLSDEQQKRSTKEITDSAEGAVEAPLEGVWQMVYTTALDVLSLAANPFTIIQGIYQVLQADGSSVNVIDFAPRSQALLPVQLQRISDTYTRARVYTSARARNETRVGLTFLRAEFAPQSFLSLDVSKSPWFPTIGVDFPRPPALRRQKESPGDSSAEYRGPGFFDVVYLDEDMLIIQQNAPGGIFVSVRRNDPISDYIPLDVKGGRKRAPGKYRYSENE